MRLELSNQSKGLALIITVPYHRRYLSRKQVKRLLGLLGGAMDMKASATGRIAPVTLQPVREVLHYGGRKEWEPCALEIAQRVVIR